MKIVANFISSLLLIFTLVLLILLILSAYSGFFDPEKHPIISNSGLGFPIILALHVFLFIFLLIFKRKLAILSFIGFVFAWPQLQTYMPINSIKTPPEKAIKVLSYNVMSFNGLKKDEYNKNDILNYIAKSNADIICLQEYASSNNKKRLTSQEIKKTLNKYPYTHIQSVGKKGSNNQLACFSKYPIKSAKKIDYLSDYNGSIAYIINIDGDDFLVINNHLESNKITKEDRVAYERLLKGVEKDKLIDDTKSLASKIIEASTIRSKQTDTIVELLTNNQINYTIVCGDFNDSPLSYTNYRLEKQLTNAFTTSGKGLGISYNQNKFYFRIDNILISNNLKAYNCTVDRSIKTSDHYPIWCFIAKQ